MMRNFYPELFHGEPEEGTAKVIGLRVQELSEFLSCFGLLDKLRGVYRKRVGFHNSCHSARELGLRNDYNLLFQNIEGLDLVETSSEQVCCGFGGLFCQKFQGISKGMAKSRLEMFEQAGAEMIVSNDPGCIMHLRMKATELGCKIPINHTTQLIVEALGL
jgi:L-lactate dehydrogenase complex protein LldE